MGWLDTPQDRRRQYTNVWGHGSITDLDRIHERDRTRKINAILWGLFIACGGFGYSFWKLGLSNSISDLTTFGYWLVGFAILFLVIIFFRYGLHKKIKLGKYKRRYGGWEQIDRLPNWAYRKMKRKHSHKVNGDHYVYKREGNKFYRKLR